MNYFIVNQKDRMIWADEKEPVKSDFVTIIDVLADGHWHQLEEYKTALSIYNSRLHYPYSTELNWREGQRVEEGKDFVLDGNLIAVEPVDAPLQIEVESRKATNIPDGENDWPMGAEIYTREQVFKLLFTQRAMISNDLKSNCGDSLTKEIYEVLENPRIPHF